jgi:hypothetical protein
MSKITIKGDAQDIVHILPSMPNPSQAWYGFSSPDALMRHLQSKDDAAWWCRDIIEHGQEYFYGTASIEEAYALCRDGWQEGATRVASIRDKIVTSAPVQKRYARYAVAGAIPNVPRYLAGNPQHMLRLESASARQRPVITLVNHMGGPARIASQTFVNKCAVVAALVDVIEASGFSCHVLGVAQSSYDAKRDTHLCGVAVTVKNAGEHVDIGRMAFALGHVAMFRRLVLGVRASDAINKPLKSNLGATVDFQSRPDGIFMLPSMVANESFFDSEERAMTRGLEHFVSTLREQGCPAFRDDAMAA